MNKSTVKNIVSNHSILLSRIYNYFCFNKKKIKGRGNVIKSENSFLSHCEISIIGDNNTSSYHKGYFMVCSSGTVSTGDIWRSCVEYKLS